MTHNPSKRFILAKTVRFLGFFQNRTDGCKTWENEINFFQKKRSTLSNSVWENSTTTIFSGLNFIKLVNDSGLDFQNFPDSPTKRIFLYLVFISIKITMIAISQWVEWFTFGNLQKRRWENCRNCHSSVELNFENNRPIGHMMHPKNHVLLWFRSFLSVTSIYLIKITEDFRSCRTGYCDSEKDDQYFHPSKGDSHWISTIWSSI